VTPTAAPGLDFGTSSTVAVLRWPDGRVRPLLFDGSPLLPSAVYANGAELLTGTDAAYSARVRPECFEPNPKRRIDDGAVLLGEREVPVPELIAAVMARVWSEATRTLGSTSASPVLTFPSSWGPRRRETLQAWNQTPLATAEAGWVALGQEIQEKYALVVPIYYRKYAYLRGSHVGGVAVSTMFGLPNLATAYLTS
jgi:hypothetical protein